MTKARVIVRDDECAYCAVGHATGSEAVCAAVSAITYTLAGWLENNVGDAYKYLSDGATTIICRSESERVKAVFEAAGIGLLQIADQYPQYLSVNYEKA